MFLNATWIAFVARKEGGGIQVELGMGVPLQISK